MKCCVLGLGYIGLPTAAVLANAGHEVLGIDINEKIVNSLSNSEVHIKEPGLSEIVVEKLKTKAIRVSKNIEPSDVFLITVPTPFKKSNKSDIPCPDISYIIEAITSISKELKKENLIILESTSPVGTTEKIAEIILNKTGFDSNDIHIAYCPERVIPGNILYELVENDRVIGGYTPQASEKARNFYLTFCKGRLDTTSTKVAEMVKLSENTFRDINIAYANELSIICDKLNIDELEVIKFANKHPRVNILNPGCGVGGHCIAVDPWFIASQFPEETKLIQASRNVNLTKTKWVVNSIIKKSIELKKKFNKEIVIGLMGLAFKPNVDDLRESPAYFIAKELVRLDMNILGYEPNIENCQDIKLSNLSKINKDVDLAVFLVAHKEFFNLQINVETMDFCGIF